MAAFPQRLYRALYALAAAQSAALQFTTASLRFLHFTLPLVETSHVLHIERYLLQGLLPPSMRIYARRLGAHLCSLFDRLRTMVKMARSHTSGQHALSCTAVEPGQLNAAEWRLRHSGCVVTRVAPGHGLGFAVSQARQPC